MSTATREEIEENVAHAAESFHIDQQGRPPRSIRAHLVADMVVVYSAGIYTTTEENLSATDEGRKLIKSARRELRSLTRKEIEARVAQIVGRKVLRSFWDMDVRTGEQVEVYMLDHPLELVLTSNPES